MRNDEAVVKLLQDGIKIDGARVRPKPLGFRTTWVYVHYLPSEMKIEEVEREMGLFGRVIEVKRQVQEATNIENGSRVAVMEINREIPLFYLCRSIPSQSLAHRPNINLWLLWWEATFQKRLS